METKEGQGPASLGEERGTDREAGRIGAQAQTRTRPLHMASLEALRQYCSEVSRAERLEARQIERERVEQEAVIEQDGPLGETNERPLETLSASRTLTCEPVVPITSTRSTSAGTAATGGLVVVVAKNCPPLLV